MTALPQPGDDVPGAPPPLRSTRTLVPAAVPAEPSPTVPAAPARETSAAGLAADVARVAVLAGLLVGSAEALLARRRRRAARAGTAA